MKKNELSKEAKESRNKYYREYRKKTMKKCWRISEDGEKKTPKRLKNISAHSGKKRLANLRSRKQQHERKQAER